MKNLPYLLILIFSLLSCLQSPTNNRRGGNVTIDNPDNGEETENSPDFSILGILSWYTTVVTNKTVVVDVNAGGAVQNPVIFLRGSSIHDFLFTESPDLEHSYCLVFHSFKNDAKAVDQLRVRAQPQIRSDLDNNTVEYEFRIDLESSLSSGLCSGTIAIRDSGAGALNTSVSSSSAQPKDLAYTLSTTCFNNDCNNKVVESNAITLYRSDNGSISDSALISQQEIETASLSLKIQYSLNFENDTGTTCELSVCQDQNFDCCNFSSNTCVNDRTLINGIDTTTDYYNQSVNDINANPEAYKRYPDLYNICE